VLLTMTTSAPPATDLGFLLHKHPGLVPRLFGPLGWQVGPATQLAVFTRA
jgi:hypothetical protein